MFVRTHLEISVKLLTAIATRLRSKGLYDQAGQAFDCRDMLMTQTVIANVVEHPTTPILDDQAYAEDLERRRGIAEAIVYTPVNERSFDEAKEPSYTLPTTKAAPTAKATPRRKAS